MNRDDLEKEIAKINKEIELAKKLIKNKPNGNVVVRNINSKQFYSFSTRTGSSKLVGKVYERRLKPDDPIINNFFLYKFAYSKYNYLVKQKEHLEALLSLDKDMEKTLLANEKNYSDKGITFFSNLKSKTDKLWKWATSEFPTLDAYQENLIIKTSAGIMVRSKSEATIANLLYQYKIPFRYEWKTTLKNGDVVCPDFIILLPSGKFIIWEHVGLMYTTRYAGRQIEKITSYYSNGFYIGNNLIITSDGGHGELNTESFETIIKNIYNNYFAPEIHLSLLQLI